MVLKIESNNNSGLNKTIDSGKIKNLSIDIGNKVFDIIFLKDKISEFLNIYRENIFIKNNKLSNGNKDILELNTKLFFEFAKNIGVNLNDLINIQEIRIFLKEELGFGEKDKILVKNNKIFVVEYIENEPRFRGLNKEQLNNIIESIDLFGGSKTEFIHNSVVNNLDLGKLSDLELKDFLSIDFKKYINKAILKSISFKIQDIGLADGISSLIYRENFDYINAIISSRLELLLIDSDYLSLSKELKDKILNYYNISDDILGQVAEKVLNKFKSSFHRVFLSGIMPNVDEIDKFHSGIEKRLKKVFIGELINIFDNKIGLKLDNTLLDVIVSGVYEGKRDAIKYGLSKNLVDNIMINSTGSSIPYKIHKFFSYYVGKQGIYDYPEFTLSFINENNLSNREKFNQLTNKLKVIKKTGESLDSIGNIHIKKTEEKDVCRRKLTKLEYELGDLQKKYDTISKQLSSYKKEISELEKDFFSGKKIQKIKDEMKENDISYKVSSYKRILVEKKDSINTLNYILNNIDDFGVKLGKLEKLHEEHIKIYDGIISDIASIIFELKKQA